jgi:hypothetical protein
MPATDEQIREDANELLNFCVSYAKRMLRRYGEFAPFGYRMNPEGGTAIETIAQHQLPADPVMLHNLLRQQLLERAQRGSLAAAAIASNVSLAKTSNEGFADAVMIEIEHREGYTIQAFVPYKITGGQLRGFFPRIVRFGTLRTQEGKAQLFSH